MQTRLHFHLFIRYFRVLCLALTALLLVVAVYMPERTVHIFPAPNITLNPFADANTPESPNSTAELVGTGQPLILRCTLKGELNHKNCAISLVFREPNYIDETLPDFNAFSHFQALDLSRFRGLVFDIKFHGNAEGFLISIRNTDNKYPLMEEVNIAKIMSASVYQTEFNQKLFISFREFRIADWWANEYKIHRSEAVTNFSHAIAIIISIDPTAPNGVYEFEVNNIEAVGYWITREYTYLLILIIWAFFFLTMAIAWISTLRNRITSAEHSVSSLTKDALTDTLTKINNRRGLDIIVENLIQSKTSYALVVVDIDHFKTVNDTYGHNAGDKVITEIALRIKNNIREGDYLARWGGEEFVLIVQSINAHGIMNLAEKIRTAIASASIVIQDNGEGLNLAVTASCGATISRPGELFLNVFERADRALYSAKVQGRNNCQLIEA